MVLILLVVYPCVVDGKVVVGKVVVLGKVVVVGKVVDVGNVVVDLGLLTEIF